MESIALKTEIWVKAHLRRCFAEGLMCAVARKGSPEAGSIFIVVRRDHDQLSVFGSPPGPAYDEDGQRHWQPLFDGCAVSQVEVDKFVERQANIDPDIWVIDIDDPSGTGLLETIVPE